MFAIAICILPIALQFVGALELLFVFWGRDNEKKLFNKNYYCSIRILENKQLDKKTSIDILNIIWLSRCSFICICLGYFLSVLIENSNEWKFIRALVFVEESILVHAIVKKFQNGELKGHSRENMKEKQKNSSMNYGIHKK